MQTKVHVRLYKLYDLLIHFPFVGDEERLTYIKKIDFVPGLECTVDRTNLYKDVIDNDWEYKLMN